MTSSLFETVNECLLTRGADAKVRCTLQTQAAWDDGLLSTVDSGPVEPIKLAGQPDRPELVHPRKLKKRSLMSAKGRATMIHAFTHIEFNAINLALDAVYRFRNMPEAYYGNWLHVAADEAFHFQLLRDRLRVYGCDYGDFPAHNGLWDMAMRTAHDPLVRMAIVPRVLESRGLDVTPAMVDGFRQQGDQGTSEVLAIILRDEIGHVRTGTHWFHFMCDQRGLQPEVVYFQLLDKYLKGEVRCPLNREARKAAGFSDREIDRLELLCKRSVG